MSDKPERASTPVRDYEKSGLYPSDGSKPFRVWALLGFLSLVIAAIAGAAVLLNFWLLPDG
jgi:hypothetical protein